MFFFLQILALICAVAGGVGYLVMADVPKKPLGLIPPAMWFAADAGLLGYSAGIILGVEFASAVLGIVLFTMGRSEKMARVMAEDD